VNEDVEGIGFAIHYTEILDYLNKNNVPSFFPVVTKDKPQKRIVTVSKNDDPVIKKLEKLKTIYENELITKDEYEIKKKEILGDL